MSTKKISIMNRKHMGILITTLVVSLAACTQKEKPHSEADDNEWPQMDSFHMVMAESFHPFKDSGNLEPVKRLAEEMAQNAERWAADALPEKVNNDAMKALLQQLKADSRTLADKIKNGATDEEIGATLKSLHDSFHSIMESWNSEGKDDHHRH
jgi:hypothetical protein